MRSSSLTTLVLLAVAASASPTPNSGSIQVRDTWVAPQRRSAFLKRAPGPQITEGGDIMDIESLDADQYSPFSFEMPADTNAGTVTFGKTASGEGLNARYPFFFKRSGHLEARDIEGLDARKAELERREAEINASAAELVAKREAAEAAKREEEELAKREAEELEAATIKKREALESIEARERELEAAKREYEEMKQRHLDLETAALAKRAPLPQFGNNGTTGAGAGVAAALGRLTNSQAAAAARLGAGRQRLTNAFGRLGGGGRTRLRRDEGLSAFDIDTEYDFLNKREPQFSFANLISSLGNGTAGGGAGGGAGAAGGLGRLNAVNAARLQQVSQLLSSFGFNFKRDEPEVVERDYAEELAMQKRQFSFASLLSSLGNGTAAGSAGGGAGAAGGLGRLNGVQAARLQQVSQLLSSLGFNFKRDEVEESFDHVFDHPSKRQFSFASLLSSLGNGTAAGGAGGGAGAAGGLGRLNGIQAARLQQVSALLSSLGFNFKRDEEFSMADLDEELEPEHPSKRQFSFASLLSSFGNGTAAGGGGAGAGAAGGLGRLNGIQAARLQQVSALLSSLGFNFKREYEEEIETTPHLAARAFPFNTWEVPQVTAEKRVAEPFGLDEFVMEKRGF